MWGRRRLRTGLLWLAVLSTSLPLTSEQSADNATSPPRRPLADDLPDPRRGQSAAPLLRCCAEDEVLVRPVEPGGQPSCQPAPAELRWQPQLLDAASERRGPPDRRTALRTGNLSCSEGAFWLDGARQQQRFELLTGGQLYLRPADTLYPTGGFCADRLLHAGELTAAGEVPAAVTEGAMVCNVSMQQLSSLLDTSLLEPTCLNQTCFRKCCPRGLQMDPTQACIPVPAGSTLRPTFHTALTRPVDTARYRTVWGNANCPPSETGKYGRVFLIHAVFGEPFYLQTNGSLWIPSQERMVEMPQFCVEQARYSRNGSHRDDFLAIVCFGDVAPKVEPRYYVYQALLSVSAVFLLVTFVVYALIPELQNVHGRCLMSQVAALFTAYLCMISSLTPTVYNNLAFCQATAIIMYYSFMAVCFWLNVMSFDIWRTFSRVHVPASGGGKTRRFIRYSLYSWLCPLVLTAVTVFMQYAPDDVVPPHTFLRPGFGTYSCWFPGQFPTARRNRFVQQTPDTRQEAGTWEMLAYLHGPVLVLMTTNLVLFVLTAFNLLKSEQDTQMVRKKKTGVERLKIYVNLFFVMGITWIADALSVYIGSQYLWYVSDVINCLQGLIIFLLFTVRLRSRRIIQRHLDSWGICRWCRCCRLPASDGRSSALLSSKTRTTSLPTGTSSARRSQLHELEPVVAANPQAD